MRLSSPQEAQARAKIPVGKVLISPQGDDDVVCQPMPSPHRFFSLLLRIAQDCVTFTTKKARDRLHSIVTTKMMSKSYWHPTHRSARIDDMQWVIDEINKACPEGIYFGTPPTNELASNRCWGFWIDDGTD